MSSMFLYREKNAWAMDGFVIFSGLGAAHSGIGIACETERGRGHEHPSRLISTGIQAANSWVVWILCWFYFNLVGNGFSNYQSGLVWVHKKNGLLWFGTLIPSSGCSLNVGSTCRSNHTVLHKVVASHTESSLKISVNFDKIL